LPKIWQESISIDMLDESRRQLRIVAVVRRNSAGELTLYKDAEFGPGDLVPLIPVPAGVVAVVGPIQESDPALAALLTEL
jgi:hypothetical protein